MISDTPDYVICFGYDHFIANKITGKDDTIYIQIFTEPANPNFIIFDYVIGFDSISFKDRYLQANSIFLNIRLKNLGNKHDISEILPTMFISLSPQTDSLHKKHSYAIVNIYFLRRHYVYKH